MISALALFPLAGFCYQYYTSKQDEKNYPPMGDLIDVGGYKLHINCEGEERSGIPTVIIETGIWDCSQSWRLVQSKIAATTRICTYDRAGYGWSDPGPNPRTFKQMVAELKILLEKKGIQPPFIFVGHSLGGPIARYYQSQYPQDIVGIIFVDALHKEPPLFSRIFRVAARVLSFLAYFGGLQLMLKFSPALSANLEWTSSMQKTYAAGHQMKIKTFATCLNEWDGCEASFRDLQSKARSLDGIPVTVISRDPHRSLRPGTSQEGAKNERCELEKLQKQHLDESPHARFVIAEGSSHLIQLDRPDIVIDEIKKMIGVTQGMSFMSL